ncbi:MAG: hypothetical protein M5T52_15345 [Ignavibacteriaceae bacterium]|nr:hypothetical protein [Ignavibacteriaceae bacterium]
MQDYINENYAPSGSLLGTFSSAIIFTGEAGMFLSKSFELGIELPYQIYSYTENVGLGQYELAYNSVLPSVMAYYVLMGDGYNFKFGGGAGVRFVSVTESKKWQGTDEAFNAFGFGGLLRVEANTALAENVYANLGLDMRYDINGEPEDNEGKTLINNVQNENVNFDTFSLGVKLGISYLFGVSN